MKKIAYIDHSFHKKTLSTAFVIDALRDRGHTVDCFWDEMWSGGEGISFSDVLNYDAVVMFQSFARLEDSCYSLLHENVTYIPMLDQFGIWKGPLFDLRDFWRPLQGAKVLNFSAAVHGMVVGMGIRSKLVKYYQKPGKKNSVSGLHGFLWIRRDEEVSWQKVKKLIGEQRFDSFHLHIAEDPGSRAPLPPSSEDIKRYNISVSKWFDNKRDFEAVLARANVLFAPRMEEGIGQSVLDGLSRGVCVVAPNNGTMNEYIQDGVTGLLYDHEDIKPLDFSNVSSICENAYHSATKGYGGWQESLDNVVDFILMPNSVAYQGRYDYFESENRNIEFAKYDFSLKDVFYLYMKSKARSNRFFIKLRRVFYLFLELRNEKRQ